MNRRGTHQDLRNISVSVSTEGMRVLAGDVGGTKTLLRCEDGDGRTLLEGRYDSGSYPSLDALLSEFVASSGPVDAACLAVAGPVSGNTATVTNLDWEIRREVLSRVTGSSRLALINDFHAVALGVPRLSESDLLTIHAGRRDPAAPMAILGAGTGLGEAVLIPCGESFHVLPTEGGHADFAPQDEEQARLFNHLHARFGHVSWERVLSGAGLVNIFTFLGGEEIEPARIAELASEGDPRARHTVELFVDIYGSEAGNMALRLLARNGVYLAGGIAAKNSHWFLDGSFVRAFLRKGRFRPVVDTIPVHLVMNEETALIGALAEARRIAG